MGRPARALFFINAWRGLPGTFIQALRVAGFMPIPLSGAPDQKVGAAGSVIDVLRNPRLIHRVDVTGGVLAQESLAVMQQFFDERR